MTVWDEHVKQWSNPPVDDLGYIPSAEMLSWDDATLASKISVMRRNRYTGWRNYAGLWREMLKLDDTHDQDVLDFGCGTGMEALELQDSGNRVQLADISPDNLALAMRVLSLSQYPPHSVTCHLVTDEYPFFAAPPASFDAVHCSGVLHHIPWAKQIMIRFHQVLRPGGEVRLMLYSDIGWCIATGDLTRPHWSTPACEREGFDQFVRYFDAVGEYADFYSLDRLEHDFGRWFDVSEFAYLTEDARYLAAVLVRKDVTS